MNQLTVEELLEVIQDLKELVEKQRIVINTQQIQPKELVNQICQTDYIEPMSCQYCEDFGNIIMHLKSRCHKLEHLLKLNQNVIKSQQV